MDDNNFNPEQIGKVMNMIKLFQTINSDNKQENETETPEDNNIESISIEENKTNINDGLKTIEKAIPYLEPKYQKNMEIMVRVMELQKIINSFTVVSAASVNTEENGKKMLMAIKPELDDKKQKMLDLFVKVIEMKNIMEGLYGR